MIVSHGTGEQPAVALTGILAGAGDPPRSFAAVSWFGRFIGPRPRPEVLAVKSEASASRFETFSNYAAYLRRQIEGACDDMAVGLVYVIGS